ncbi:hypothetical protein FW778_00425 [Ginsengibacter hankyongi]|uniref:Uncharacterized protein n=1 Tax=Ginsengibacter hankyongi TaxID=2607284 RepID=A0A5J5IHT3_9BACT|nr:hypothetical protein [Ginsengibacter hankyongi]KAA9040549.1 hypothetical protein FW778_00425 [Ginsengibacter hankyongi]
MKKIITLVFFAGCLTTGFAQSGHRRQSNDQTDGNGYQSQQSGGYNRDQYSQHSRDGNGGYSDNQWNSRNNQNDYGYHKDRDNQERGDMRRNQYDYPRGNQRGWEDHSCRSWGRESRRHRIYRDDDRD